MQKANFEIKCKNPETVVESLGDEDKRRASITFKNNTLYIEISSEDLKSLMKISYSIMNRIALIISTIETVEYMSAEKKPDI